MRVYVYKTYAIISLVLYLNPAFCLKALCQMPQKIAKIGVDVTHVVEHCPTAHCFEKLLDYEVPDEQLFGLLQTSPSCTQRITLDCYLSPVKV